MKKEKQRPVQDGGSDASGKTQKWRAPFIIIILSLCAYRALEYHNYWNSLSPVVEVRQGPVQGRSTLTDAGREYFAFQGMPYARPPLGPLRFRDPQPAASWAPDVRDARADGPICRQPLMNIPTELASNVSVMDVLRFLRSVPALAFRAVKHLTQSEDCLHLNVFTPKVSADALLPVLVHFHGGAFLFGDGGTDLHGPQHFMDRDVVLVVIDYRLGPFGFVALGEAVDGGKAVDKAPRGVGNAGLKDALAAVLWVRDNIAQFGGDPAKVTVAGQSAGGSVAHYLTLMPAAKGLFRSAVYMSGSSLHHWAFSAPELALHRTRTLVSRLRRPGAAGGSVDENDPEDMLRYLQEVDARHLVDMDNYGASEHESRWLLDEFPWQPTADGYLVPAAPIDLIRAGRFHQVPTLLGVTAREGVLTFLSSLFKNRTLQEQAALVDADFHWALPEYLRRGLPRGSAALKQAEAHVKEHYVGKGGNFSNSLQEFVDMIGTAMFVYDMHRLTKELTAVSSAPVFSYNFTFEGRRNFGRRNFFYHVPDFKGATHSDELGYIFDIDILAHIPVQASDPEVLFQKNLMTFLTNFIKTGNPTSTVTPESPMPWPQQTVNESPVLNLNIPTSLQDGFVRSETSVWETLYESFA